MFNHLSYYRSKNSRVNTEVIIFPLMDSTSLTTRLDFNTTLLKINAVLFLGKEAYN
jgi:hypothetical protein